MTWGAITWSPGASAWKTAGRGRHAGGEQQAARAALERVQQRLGVVDGRVVGAAVAAAAAVLVVGVALVGGRGVERRDQRAGRRVDRGRAPGRRASRGASRGRSWSEPACDGEHAAGGVGRGRREQPEDRGRDLLGRADAAERDARGDPRRALRIAARGVDPGLDRAGRDRVDADALGSRPRGRGRG